ASLGEPGTTGPDDPASPAGRRVTRKSVAALVGAPFFDHRSTSRRRKQHGPPETRRAGEVVRDGCILRTLHLSDVRRLQPLRTLGDLELYLVALAQALETLGLNSAVMNEHVLAAFDLDKAVSLRVVKPLHRALCHTPFPSLDGAGLIAPVIPAPMAGGVPMTSGTTKKSAEGPSVLSALTPQTRATPTAKSITIRPTIWNAEDFTMVKKTVSSSFRVLRGGGRTSPGPHLGGPGGTLRGAEPSDFPDVSGLETLGAARDVELDAVAFGKGFEALSLDRGVVNEHVLAAVLRDESVPLGLVEPLHSSVCHASVPCTFLRGRAP